MSLFDFIKYPIGSPPDQKEFDELPDDIFRYWLKTVGWDVNRTKIYVAQYYRGELTAQDKRELSTLRKIIKEWP